MSCFHTMGIVTQLDKQKNVTKGLELNTATLRSRLAEVESAQQNQESENSQLRRDKMLLVDHVADLQKRVSVTQTTKAARVLWG